MSSFVASKVGMSDFAATIADMRWVAHTVCGRWVISIAYQSIAIHQHVLFYIQTGSIDGTNRAFTITIGSSYDVYVNGLLQSPTLTDTGFVLDYAPDSGDYVWCEVVI